MKNYPLGFTHEQLLAITPGTVGCMVYKCIVADTIRERGEAILCKITELANIITFESGSGYMWVVCSHMIYKHILYAVKESDEELFEYGDQDIMFMGIIDRKIRVYVDPIMSINVMYLGNTGEHKADPKHFVRFTFSGMPGGEKDQWDLDPEFLYSIGVNRLN